MPVQDSQDRLRVVGEPLDLALEVHVVGEPLDLALEDLYGMI